MSKLINMTDVKKSNKVILVFIVFLAMFIVSASLMYEDYSTSLAGYQMLPTQKVNPWVIPLVALVPQLLQIGFTYIYLTDTDKKWAQFVVICAFLIDSSTDVFFKSQGLASPALVIMSLLESIMIYTIGSELMFATSASVMVDLLPDTMKSFGRLFDAIGHWIGNGKRTSNVYTATTQYQKPKVQPYQGQHNPYGNDKK